MTNKRAFWVRYLRFSPSLFSDMMMQSEPLGKGAKMDLVIKEAVVAYRTRWEEVAAVDTENLRRITLADSWRKLNSVIGVMMALGQFQRLIEQNQAEAEETRRRWVILKAGQP